MNKQVAETRKTIFFTIYDGDIEKNYLRSGVLDRLLDHGMHVVLLIRAEPQSARHQYYIDNFSRPGVTIEILPRAMTAAERYWYHLSWNSLPTRSSYVKRHDLYLRHRNLLRYILEQIAWCLGHIRLWREFLRALYFYLPDNYGSTLFDTYKPVLLFAPNMFSAEDCRLIKAARKRHVPTLTTAKSWDVPTTRGFTRVKADRALVFNEINAEEMVRIGDYKKERVFPMGFPQFDFYKKDGILIDRNEFYAQIGADPEKELLLFAVPGDFKNPFSHQILEGLDAAIERGAFIKPVQVLARFHPKYPSKAEELAHLKHIIKDRPGTYFSKRMEAALDAPLESTFEWTFTNDDLAHLANSLAHSAVTINTESTMTLDAASLDRPVVLIGFDGNEKVPYWESIMRNYGREHLQAVLRTEGVRLAHSLDELVEYVNGYLSDPARDAEGRARLRKELLFGNDGHAADRVAKHILEMAGVS